MKKSLIILFALSLVLTIPNQSNAQAFGGKGSKAFLVGVGFSNYPTFFTENNVGVKGTYNPFGFNVGVQGEFGIHEYVGLGFTAGATFSGSLGSAPGFGNVFASNWSNIGIPLGMIGNFHFLQLIADKTGGSFAEQMDVYAGLALGAGPSFAIPKPGSNVSGDVGVLFIGEVHAGIRYYFNDKLGVFAEVGQGRSSRLQGGLALKF
ncbi:MAG: hypothetical protein COA32_07550 [Fluviicola sp.]|nr:MAG: hypothetical protein COA32_07550 [Fluviicola sp.]